MKDQEPAKEISAFQTVWKGGYLEGDPLDPLSRSTYGRLGYISILYAVYLACIRPYVTSSTRALEIGPGRGAWTRALLEADEVWALDAKSREDNGIDEYVGNAANLIYHQVSDFSCSELPEDYFDYVFSFGCFCHISWEGTCQYARNMFPKLRSGAECFWMVADYEQRNRIAAAFKDYDIVARLLPPGVMRMVEWWNARKGYRHIGRPWLDPQDPDEDQTPSEQARWYHAGADRTARMLEETGYVVLSKDIGFALRDPILHFRRP